MKSNPRWKANRRSLAMAVSFAVILIISVAGVWTLANATIQKSIEPPSGTLHLALQLIGSGWSKTYDSNASRNNSAFSFLVEAARVMHFSLVWQNWTVPPNSVFIHAINGDVNGQGGRWWQYWINGGYGSMSANSAELREGDVLEWRFAQYPP